MLSGHCKRIFPFVNIKSSNYYFRCSKLGYLQLKVPKSVKYERISTQINYKQNRLFNQTSSITVSQSQAQKLFFSTGRESPAEESLREKNIRAALYALSVVIGFLGLTYASVPLYKIFCQKTGFGGTTQRASVSKAENVKPVKDGRLINVRFDGNVSDMLPWTFKPQQLDVKVVPGETALAFFTARNNSSKNITGVATYNVFPSLAGIHFNKIQCFCFEQQRLRAGEEIDMPVFFFIDPEFVDDPAMDSVANITLSYTFFKTGEDEIGLGENKEEEEEEEEEDSDNPDQEQDQNSS